MSYDLHPTFPMLCSSNYCRFADTIAGQFYGHLHFDTFQVFEDQHEKAISVGFLTPSIATYWSLNPGYRIYETEGSPSWVTHMFTTSLNNYYIQPFYHLTQSFTIYVLLGGQEPCHHNSRSGKSKCWQSNLENALQCQAGLRLAKPVSSNNG